MKKSCVLGTCLAEPVTEVVYENLFKNECTPSFKTIEERLLSVPSKLAQSMPFENFPVSQRSIETDAGCHQHCPKVLEVFSAWCSLTWTEHGADHPVSIHSLCLLLHRRSPRIDCSGKEFLRPCITSYNKVTQSRDIEQSNSCPPTSGDSL